MVLTEKEDFSYWTSQQHWPIPASHRNTFLTAQECLWKRNKKKLTFKRKENKSVLNSKLDTESKNDENKISNVLVVK